MKKITNNLVFKSNLLSNLNISSLLKSSNSISSLSMTSKNLPYSFSKFNFNYNNKNNVDDMIDNMLKSKGRDNRDSRDTRDYRDSRDSRDTREPREYGSRGAAPRDYQEQGTFRGGFQRRDSFPNQNNQGVQLNGGQIGNTNFNSPDQLAQRYKRNKVIFIKDGMMITFSFSRNFVNLQNQRRDGYIHVEIKEATELNQSTEEVGAKREERFIILNAIPLTKLLLLTPKLKVDTNNLNSININHKFRELTISETAENKYLFKVSVASKDQIEAGKADEKLEVTKSIVGQIEITPEEFLYFQLFAKSCVEQIAGF